MHFEFGNALLGDSQKWPAGFCISQMMAQMMFTQDESPRRTCLTHFLESYLPSALHFFSIGLGISKQLAICCFQLQRRKKACLKSVT